jgi:hypothetical protein
MAESKNSANGWVRIANVRSESNAAQWYIIGLRQLKVDGKSPHAGQVELGCDCPSRRYLKGTKPANGFAVTCKHGRALMSGEVSLSNLSLTVEGVAFFDSLKVVEGSDSERNVKALAMVKAKVAAQAVKVA